MRPGGAEREVELSRQFEQLSPPLHHDRGRVGKRLAAACADLHLGGDQLADEMLFDLRALRGRLKILEAVDEAEAARIEDRELLLDRDREVLARVEALASGADLFLGTELLGLTHAAKVSERQSSPSSTARPRLRGRPTTAEPILGGEARGSPRASRPGRRRSPA